MTEEIKKRNENSQSESRLINDGAPEILSLVVLWNDLYGHIMYKLPVPEKGDPVYRLFCERISEHGYAGVREGIIRVGQSKYLLGRKGLPPIAITSLLKPHIFSRVLTGYYSDPVRRPAWKAPAAVPRERQPARKAPAPVPRETGQEIKPYLDPVPAAAIPNICTPAEKADQAPLAAANKAEEKRSEERRPAPPNYDHASYIAPKKHGLEHRVDLDAWLIDQIIHSHPLSS